MAGCGWTGLSAAGAVNPGIPPHLSLMYRTGERRWGQPGTGGFLGVGHSPFPLIGSQGLSASDDMTLSGISLERLSHRDGLLQAFDQFRQEADVTGIMEGMDVYHQQSLGILTSRGLCEALDLSQEDPAVLARYGRNDPEFSRDVLRRWCRISALLVGWWKRGHGLSR